MVALEEPRPQRGLQQPDLPAQRGLGDEEPLVRGPGKAEFFRDGDKVPEVTQVCVHSTTLWQEVLDRNPAPVAGLVLGGEVISG
jgi:hypothetical protein